MKGIEIIWMFGGFEPKLEQFKKLHIELLPKPMETEEIFIE
ncbi:MAG: hypothetical protein ACFE9C_13700 [Candidatus Hodarchaeota archaeon]